MKTIEILFAVLLSSLIALPAIAAPETGDTSGSIGINYGQNSTIGIQLEIDISSMTDNEPFSVQAFWKHFSQHLSGGATSDTSGIGAVVIYDFNRVAKLDKTIHPYIGMGLMSISYEWSGSGPVPTYTGLDSGLYLAGGLRYVFSPLWAADVNYNLFSDFTVGVNYSF